MFIFREVRQQTITTLLFVFFSLTFLVTGSGCGLLVGNVKPIDEKSQSYRALDLSKEGDEWKRLEPSASVEPTAPVRNTETYSSEISDMTFQSKKTASIISLNSACRNTRAKSEQDLHEITQQLLLGITDVTKHEEKTMDIEKVPALETTLAGKLNGEPVALKTVVLKKDTCVYDLMFVARPEYFDEQQADFSRFVASIRLR